ncbi:MAG: hypothetical protein NZ693_11000 [Thermoflexales bacterium]|nr:hypothetical protein [Thermoflexales bacterium]
MTDAYDPKVTPWAVKGQALPQDSPEAQLTFLLRFAILAPSTYNTQPWKFRAAPPAIHVFADPDRRMISGDADLRELFTSVGCALENLLVAAEHFGFAHQTVLFPNPEDQWHVAAVDVHPNGQRSPHRAHLFDCIPARHTNHRRYNGRPIPEDVLDALRRVVVEPEVRLQMTADPVLRRRADELLVEADAHQFADPTFRRELLQWVTQGAFGSAWLLGKIGRLAARTLHLSAHAVAVESEPLMNASVFGVIATEASTRAAQVVAGQVYERIHLQATYLGLSMQPVNQLLQVPHVKEAFIRSFNLSPLSPQLAFRLGYAEPEAEHTPRRPLEACLK